MLKMNEHDAGIQMNPVPIDLEMEHWSHLQDVSSELQTWPFRSRAILGTQLSQTTPLWLIR